ncbi:hypothetical protein HEP81_06544 [Streptomyces griseofuscus]|uniref:Uncharacterized protein n=1 Tax=Streptomyces griseofuscus TaxID=146922 RepID=A0A7H1Q8Z9_9ACTN|nr:hypothetical protein [Streptomyces griseofuscus]QNT96779.1 hypothetical protein HEP81_06544 [Streptomyces griseofuscus]
MTTHPVSPNTVLANALTHAEDVLAPRIRTMRPARVTFVVGTQINGVPHLGTSLVQSLTFAAAARVRQRFDLPVDVKFGALDNAPHEVVTDATSGHRYQRSYVHALGEAALVDLVNELYRPLFDALSERLAIPYSVEMYSGQQQTEQFRRTWLRAHRRVDASQWWLDPAHGTPHVRVPCPAPGCGWAEKYAERTRVFLGDHHAVVHAVCLHHGPYEIRIAPDSGGYLDLATLYRNLVKELAASADHGRLSVMVKGGDWVFGSTLVDNALTATGLCGGQLPARLFCPQVVTDTGAKLSKSLIRDGKASLPEGSAPWMLDTRMWPGSLSEYADQLLAMADTLLSDPRHFFRSYSAGELGRLMSTPTRSVTAP